MAKITNQIKLTWLKAMETLGNTASNMADSARYKVLEMNLETRRREILAGFSKAALELWQKGEALPSPLNEMLAELNETDEKLCVLRAQKHAHVEEEQVEEKNGESSLSQESETQEALERTLPSDFATAQEPREEKTEETPQEETQNPQAEE